MANWLTQLFAQSPFGPLIEHQRRVQACVEVVPKIVTACLRDDQRAVKDLAKEVSVLEYEADQLKTKVRDGLPKSMFMQVSRGDLLDVLSSQDKIADCAEDIGVLLNMRKMESPPDEVGELLEELVNCSVEVVRRSTEVVEQLETLANASFSGPAAKVVLNMIDAVDRHEHLSDKIQDQLVKAFFRHEDEFKPAAIVLWLKIFRAIGELANYAEAMTHRIRLFLAK